uniref:MIF4G domain-containing protein n=1 Tax=Moniliophthora roreri TaxID=221103 RepID=A0A0W0FH57_MONRR
MAAIESIVNGSASTSKIEDERARNDKRLALKQLNENPSPPESSKLDSSLKRHTALIKRIRQSMAADNRDQILKDIDTLSLEKYVDEIVGATLDGIVKCKTEKDVWSAVEAISSLHRRFPKAFTPALVASLASALSVPSRASLQSLSQEQREKEDASRVTRQRPILRISSELALVGVIRDGPGRSGGEWIMKVMKEMLSNDPTLSSLPLLSSFLKSYSYPFLGIVPPSSSRQIPTSSELGSLSASQPDESSSLDMFPSLTNEADQLVEKDIRDRFKRMCEGYFDNVCKKLLKEHTRLQEQDRRNHEAYIRSGEIFEDRQQAYEKMTKGYEKLLANCQQLSELLYLPLPTLPTSSRKTESIQIGLSNGNVLGGEDSEKIFTAGGKWEDEEERKFYEEVQDLKDFVPKSVLGLEGEQKSQEEDEEQLKKRMEQEKEEFRKLEEELEKLNDGTATPGSTKEDEGDEPMDDAPTPTPGTPKAATPPLSPALAPQGPSQLLSALLARLPDATNRALIDQAAIDFAFLNSKAARKRLFLAQVPKNRTDLLPHYSRLVATLNRYMPDIGTELVGILDDEFRYLQKKKNVMKDLSEVRLKNIMYLSNLSKFRVVPTHVILHIFKVCLDDFSGNNVENLALLLEGCGRFLLRSEDTRERFGTMLELMRRKQSMQHFDQRQLLLLENAYYQAKRSPRQEKERSPMELFIRHLIYDVLAKKTIDKVFKLIRKLDWDDENVRAILFKIFTKPWKLKFSNISLVAMLTYDLQRYHPSFSVSVVDQVLEDIRRGLEQNVYSTNQRRVATIKYLGELYIYRLLSSGIVFDTLWSLVTFGHPDGRPLPQQICTLDMPDDFFRVRLVCALLDTCGMCFDRGTQKKKLDNFLTFFQYYIHCKNELPMDVDFLISDSLEAVRPKMQLVKTLEEAAIAVDDMLQATFQNMEATDGEDSGEDSGGEEDERADIDKDEEDEEDTGEDEEDTNGERPPSPEEAIVISSSQENFGPSEEADAEFAKELTKLVTDNSAEARKVDKKTALALWDSSILPPAVRNKKRAEDLEDEVTEVTNGNGVMNFTIVTKRGNKHQTRQLAIPAESALAIHTRKAQQKDKVEQQHLKRLVLDYEQREEAEELKALEARNRAGAVKIRYVG